MTQNKSKLDQLFMILDFNWKYHQISISKQKELFAMSFEKCGQELYQMAQDWKRRNEVKNDI